MSTIKRFLSLGIVQLALTMGLVAGVVVTGTIYRGHGDGTAKLVDDYVAFGQSYNAVPGAMSGMPGIYAQRGGYPQLCSSRGTCFDPGQSTSLFGDVTGSWGSNKVTTISGTPVITAGLTASGAVSNDFSGSTGTYKTSTGAVTIGPGAVTISGALTVPAATLNYATVSVGTVGALGAATDYLLPGFAAAQTTELQVYAATRAATVRSLYCNLVTAPGGSDTVAVTVRKNASDQTLTCTISAAGVACNDITHSFAVIAADGVSVKAVSSAGTAAKATCSFEVGN